MNTAPNNQPPILRRRPLEIPVVYSCKHSGLEYRGAGLNEAGTEAVRQEAADELCPTCQRAKDDAERPRLTPEQLERDRRLWG